METKRYWTDIVKKANQLREWLDEKPDEYKTGYQCSTGGILNAYREGDLNFDEARAELDRLINVPVEQQVSLGASQPMLLAEDSKEYKLWCEIVTDITTYAGTDEGINIIEKIENLFGLDNKDNFNELEKKAVTHLNSLKNTWE